MSCAIWPRHETLNLVLPIFANSGKALTPETIIAASVHLYSLRGMANGINFESWLIVAKDKLKWTDSCIHIFWDLLKSAVGQVGGFSENEDVDEVIYDYVVIFLALHIPSVSSKTTSNHSTFEAVWPQVDVVGGITTPLSSAPTSPSRSSPPSPNKMIKLPSSPNRSHGSGTLALSSSPEKTPGSPRAGGASSPRHPRFSPSRQLQSGMRHVQLLRDRLPLLVQILSSGLEKEGAVDASQGQREFIMTRRTFDRLDLVLCGAENREAGAVLLSTLHPSWAEYDAQMTEEEAAMATATATGQSQEMRVSSSLTIINDGEGGSVPSMLILDFLQAHVQLNEAVCPASFHSQSAVHGPSSSTGERVALTSSSPPSSLALGAATASCTLGPVESENAIAAPFRALAQPSRPQQRTTVFDPETSLRSARRPELLEGLFSSTSIRHSVVMHQLPALEAAASEQPPSRGRQHQLAEEAVDLAEGGAWGPAARLPPLVVQNCAHANVYELAPFSSVHIVGCRDCTIVVGAVAGTALLSLCERVTLVTTCQKLVVQNSLDCKLSLATLSPTTITGDSRGLSFAPLSTNYAQLEGHMVAAGLLPLLPQQRRGGGQSGLTSSVEGAQPRGEDDENSANFWAVMYNVDSCLDPTPTQGSPSGYAIDAARQGAALPFPTEHVAVVSDPSEFHAVTVPDPVLHTELTACSVHLPRVYLAQCIERRRVCEGLKDELRSSLAQLGTSRDATLATGSALSDKFLQWLVTSGKAQAVMDLVALDASGGA